jgi:hypothetical protein
MATGPDPRRVLGERTVLAMAVCRALVDAGSPYELEVRAAHGLYRRWMRDRGLWEDTDVPGADVVAEGLEELSRKAFHAEIVIGRLELLLGADLHDVKYDRVALTQAVDAWRRNTGYEPAKSDYPPSPRLP